MNADSGSQNEQLAKLVDHTQMMNKKLEESIQALQESLDDLRIVVKYQAFDLEVTRRENEYLKSLLKEQIDES